MYLYGLVNDAPAPALYRAQHTERGQIRVHLLFTAEQHDVFAAAHPDAEIMPLDTPPAELTAYLRGSGIHRTSEIPAAIARWESGLGGDPMEILSELLTGGND